MSTLTSNIKRLVATDKKYHEAPVYIIPKQDPKTRKVRDYISRLPEELRAHVSVNLDPQIDKDNNITDEMTIRCSHLMIFDLSNANDALFFEVVKEDTMIAASKDVVNPQIHRYYIEDKEKEAVAVISKSKLKGQAFAVIAQLSLEQMVNYARVLGKWVTGLSGTQVESALYDLAEKDPQIILNVNTDKDLKYKIFLRRCVEKNIIHIDGGKYMSGKDLIGISEEYAIHWLRDQANAPIVTQWNKVLNERPQHEPRIESFPLAGTEMNNGNGLDDPGSMTP